MCTQPAIPAGQVVVLSHTRRESGEDTQREDTASDRRCAESKDALASRVRRAQVSSHGRRVSVRATQRTGSGTRRDGSDALASRVRQAQSRRSDGELRSLLACGQCSWYGRCSTGPAELSASSRYLLV